MRHFLSVSSTTVFEHFNGSNVATHAFAQITWAVTADFVKVVYTDSVSPVVSDNIVDTLAEELDAVAFDQFPGFHADIF
jgi:hypothetical protein